VNREALALALMFFVLGCAILLRLDDVIFSIEKGKIIVVKYDNPANVIEGEAKPVTD